eukprot:8614248-Alexandrium_andersonii.AAC.1
MSAAKCPFLPPTRDQVGTLPGRKRDQVGTKSVPCQRAFSTLAGALGAFRTPARVSGRSRAKAHENADQKQMCANVRGRS